MLHPGTRVILLLLLLLKAEAEGNTDNITSSNTLSTSCNQAVSFHKYMQYDLNLFLYQLSCGIVMCYTPGGFQ